MVALPKMQPTAAFIIFLSYITSGVNAQASPAAVQSTGFNSSFTLTQAQIDSAELPESVARNIENIINFDRSQLAFGGPYEDDFYTLPPLTNQTGPLEPGVLLKVQQFTDPTSYVIPPNTALSRILYTTTNLNGTVVPTSAFVLWPYQPRQFQPNAPESNDTLSAPVVLWAHGTSGFFPNASPSAHRALWYGDATPFALALEGYAVVAPDYAGIGISKSWDGSNIPHQYLASPASASDALYSLQASWEAFSGKLSKDFVVMGHSQGGGVAWAVAETLESRADDFIEQVRGYRGTIAGSPTTDVFDSGYPQFLLPWIGMALPSIFADFQLDSWLTPLGISRTKVLQEIEGGISASMQLYLTGGAVINEGYNETSWYAASYSKLGSAGNKSFKGPMLVIQGTNDSYVSYDVTEKTVNSTCELFPESDLRFLVLPEVGHVPALRASQSVWLQWIADRFEGKPAQQNGCHRIEMKSFLPIAQYQASGNSFPQWVGAPEYSYQAPLGP